MEKRQVDVEHITAPKSHSRWIRSRLEVLHIPKNEASDVSYTDPYRNALHEKTGLNPVYQLIDPGLHLHVIGTFGIPDRWTRLYNNHTHSDLSNTSNSADETIN